MEIASFCFMAGSLIGMASHSESRRSSSEVQLGVFETRRRRSYAVLVFTK